MELVLLGVEGGDAKCSEELCVSGAYRSPLEGCHPLGLTGADRE